MRRLLKAGTRMCGIIRRSTAVQTWTTGRLLHSAISSQLRERVVFLSEPEDSLVSLILGNTSKGQFVDGVSLFILSYRLQDNCSEL